MCVLNLYPPQGGKYFPFFRYEYFKHISEVTLLCGSPWFRVRSEFDSQVCTQLNKSVCVSEPQFPYLQKDVKIRSIHKVC